MIASCGSQAKSACTWRHSRAVNWTLGGNVSRRSIGRGAREIWRGGAVRGGCWTREDR